MNTIAPKFIDTDVHVRWEDDNIIAEHLSAAWKERWLTGAGHTQAGLRINPKFYNPREPLGHEAPKTVGRQGVTNANALMNGWMMPNDIDAALEAFTTLRIFRRLAT